MLMSFDRPRAHDPFAQMRRLQTDINRLFDGTETRGASRGYPPVNMWLGENSLVITAELPGMSHDDIDATIRDDTLIIRGERKLDVPDEQVAWHRRERAAGRFVRTIELPFRVDPDRVEARFTNGVLQVEMQRPEADRPRKISIKAA